MFYTTMSIIWKEIEDNYEVSNTGLIRNKNSKKIRKLSISGKYYTVSLSNKKYLPKETKTFRVHRLVAYKFIDNPNNYKCINHKDGNKLNNNVNNLEWCTYSQNTQHAVNTGLLKNTIQEHEIYDKIILKDCIKIIDYNNYYISRDGCIYNDKYKLKQCVNNGGDIYVTLHNNGQKKNLKVKNLVSKHYNNKYKDDDIIYHKDGNKNNNNIDNLEIGTISDCMQVYDKKKFKKFGQYDNNNNLIKEWRTIAEASKEIQPNKPRSAAICISKCLNNHQNTARGFKWKYIE